MNRGSREGGESGEEKEGASVTWNRIQDELSVQEIINVGRACKKKGKGRNVRNSKCITQWKMISRLGLWRSRRIKKVRPYSELEDRTNSNILGNKRTWCWKGFWRRRKRDARFWQSSAWGNGHSSNERQQRKQYESIQFGTSLEKGACNFACYCEVEDSQIIAYSCTKESDGAHLFSVINILLQSKQGKMNMCL